MSHAVQSPLASLLHETALEAIHALRTLMRAAIAPNTQGQPTNPSQARLAASQLLNLAARFTAVSPPTPARQPPALPTLFRSPEATSPPPSIPTSPNPTRPDRYAQAHQHLEAHFTPSPSVPHPTSTTLLRPPRSLGPAARLAAIAGAPSKVII